jgi:hypothetical protein
MKQKSPWYRIVIECGGVPPDVGTRGADDITEGFAKRPWHKNAVCRWDGAHLTLTAENDFDPEGLALSDEFSDEICACIGGLADADCWRISVTQVA